MADQPPLHTHPKKICVFTSTQISIRVDHPYIVRKSEKSLDVDEPTFNATKTARYRLQQQTKVGFSVPKYSKTAQKALNKAAAHGFH